jgi:predicted Zn-dependent peptidase
MLRISQSVIYYNKIRSVEDTVKKIQEVTSKDIMDMSNEIFESGALRRVVLSPKNLLLQKAF